MTRGLCIAFLAGGIAAYGGTINFDSDTTGGKANGFQSVDSAIVSFADSNGTGLSIAALGTECGGSRCLLNGGDDAGRLIMTFSAPQTSLSFGFGNDDPGFSSAGDRAALTLFSGVTQVGQVFVVMNRNDLMDQTISFSGAAFNSAEFIYTNGANLNGISLLEVVDNIQFAATVPEPATIGLSGLGILALGLIRRRFAKK